MLLQAALALPSEASPATDGLLPVSKWVVDYEPDACIVARNFGDKNAPTNFGFRLWPLASTMELVLAGGSADLKLPEQGQLEITTNEGPMDDPGWFQSGETKLKTDAKPMRLTVIRTGFDAFRQRASATTWVFAYKDKSVRLRTGPMTDVLNALKDCEKDLLKTWKIDPAELDHPELRAKPIGNPDTWFGPANYPSTAKAAGAEARIVTFLTVDATGRVTDCRALGKHSGFEFEKVTCNLFIHYGRYAPPLDPTGKPVISHVIAPPVRWQLRDY